MKGWWQTRWASSPGMGMRMFRTAMGACGQGFRWQPGDTPAVREGDLAHEEPARRRCFGVAENPTQSTTHRVYVVTVCRLSGKVLGVVCVLCVLA